MFGIRLGFKISKIYFCYLLKINVEFRKRKNNPKKLNNKNFVCKKKIDMPSTKAVK